MKLFSIFLGVVAGMLIMDGSYILASMAIVLSLYDQKGWLFD